ncbi:LysM domain [Candidatus Rhabdochlamydia oedothoracis]|uniref:LysM domain n=1 Tax=Candidatus Rhabdochlamydia oedothoracis TaxID=2720720 RepID=A0ABX8V1Q8_9BACT|nr:MULTISPECIES: LysM peptidoglycan-binding domain-containing protein [Rhabdochlamydia]KAG6559447.1 D-gamma-glutamyl-meso-diaminopimelic acid endopeptidase CwlS [Candidatus Rhabdochlamydia sp. W815]MCL6756216.1 LysM peptidoglycan-binding domain-containing protein [Candidatus Rhabdochlamydia oedothoracis]QYF49129.1 LysM domain [Candidatus Rhabdochlamydia oedothoracis]
MSRKDTIIIAVLVNAGLLIILFASALKPHMHNTCYQPEPLKPIVDGSPKKEVVIQKGDAVDHALEQFAKQRLNTVEQPVVIQNPVIAGEPRQVAILENKTEKLAGQEVTIKKGDMLEKIARQHHTTVHEIMRLNGLQTSHLRIGQILKIPSNHTASPVLEETTQYYIVKEGDNPSIIAKKNNIKLEILLNLNEMSEEKARKLRPGDKLRIR